MSIQHSKSDTITALSTSLALAQLELTNAQKSSSNPFFKSKYADLSEVISVVRNVFNTHGLSVVQLPSYTETTSDDLKMIRGQAHVETILMHKSGEWISSIASAPVAKQDAQGVGAATTYLRRYALAALACIGQEDDDGETACGRAAKVAPALDSKAEKHFIENILKLTSSNDRVEALKRCLDKLQMSINDVASLTDDQIEQLTGYLLTK